MGVHIQTAGLWCEVSGNMRTSVRRVWEVTAELKGIVCDLQTHWDRRGFSGRSELRVLRRHSLAGQPLQSSMRLALNDPAHAYKARTLRMHR